MRCFNCILFLFFVPLIALAEVSLDSLKNRQMLLVEIHTVNREEPSSESIHRPAGCLGDGITNVTKVPGRIKLWKSGILLYDSGDYLKDESGMTIRHRGNTSAAFHDKKPFKIKLQKKADLLMRNNISHKDKDWLLLRGTTLNEDLAWTIDKLLNDNWVPSFSYCNVIINDEYRGLYLLSESIKKAKDRIDIDDDGYIFEYDAYWWNEPLYFPSKWKYEFQYTLKYPDPDDISSEQIAYISDYTEQMEYAMDRGQYEDFIDIQSWARWMLVHDILGSYDQAGSNKFLIKQDSSAKIHMGPVWDFDGIEMTKDNWARIHYYAPYGSILFPSDNKTYSFAYVNLWNSKKKEIVSTINKWLQNKYNDSTLLAELDSARVWDYQKWGEEVKTTTLELDAHRQWFDERMPWLEENINLIDIGNLSTNIITPKEGTSNTDAIYNLYGLLVNSDYKGVVITGEGKKKYQKLYNSK